MKDSKMLKEVILKNRDAAENLVPEKLRNTFRTVIMTDAFIDETFVPFLANTDEFKVQGPDVILRSMLDARFSNNGFSYNCRMNGVPENKLYEELIKGIFD